MTFQIVELSIRRGNVQFYVNEYNRLTNLISLKHVSQTFVTGKFVDLAGQSFPRAIFQHDAMVRCS